MTKQIRITFAVALIVSCINAQAQISSTFDTDADGWTYLNNVTSIPGVYSATGGNPAGFVSVTYSSNTNFGIQNWIAPSKFLGNQLLRSLGLNLKFDLQQSQAGTTGGFDVRIMNGNSFIYFVLPTKPAVAPAWSSYTLTLDETTAWKFSAGNVTASRDQIISVLKNVTSIEIRGTYATNASYTSGLDNVMLEQRTLTPAPVATSLSATSGKPGDVITISGSGFNATPSNNSVSFGTLAGTKAVVQSATTNQLQVVVPVGASYGPITITNTVSGLTSKTPTPFNPVFDGGGRIIPASYRDKFAIATIGIEGWFVGDFDGDGWEDFAVANNNTDDVIDIYRNLGLGGNLSAASFDTKVSVSIPQLAGSGTNGAGLWFADLDGDGKLDAVSSNATSAISAAFITLRNMSTPGNLVFEEPEYWTGGSDETPISLVADLDGDGRPELLAGEGSMGSTTFNYFWVNQNISTPGNIEFGGPLFPFNGTVVNGFAGSTAGDLNGDGKNELIISHNFGDRFTVLENTSTPAKPSFLNSFTITTGQYNRSMKVVDINLDGKNDLVWKKSGGGVYIRINTDSDGILTDTDFATEYILTSDLGANGGIAIVDFNGDGKPDIASTDDIDVGVYESVFSGGVFATSAYVPAYQVLGTGGSSGSPVVSDFNRDGKPDLVMAGSASITIVENKNRVGPQISVNTVTPLSGPVGTTVTITGNNFSTISSENEVYFGAVKATVLTATANEITVTVPAGAAYSPVSVRRGELTSRYRLPFVPTFSSGVTFDNTHFAPPINFTLTNANYDIEVGDLNNDGKPDVLAEGSGGFAFRNTHSSGAISTSSLVADDTLSAGSFINPRIEDLDGDGYLDVASVNGLAHRNISTPTEISFQPSITIGLGANTMDIADFNNDGKMDITVTTDLSGAGDLLIKENRTTAGNFVTGTYASFSTNIIFNKPAANGGIAAEDFDGDGFADIATTNPLIDNISVYRNAGILKVSNAQFASRLDLAVGDNPGRIYKGDFDADGKVDLLLYHSTGTTTTLLTVFYNTSTVGNISFTRIDLTNPSATAVATIADLDGDGKPEIITTSETGNRFSIFKNIHTTGALTAASFAAPFNTTVTAPRGIATGDLNLDGKPEIILTRAAGLLVVYENLIPSIPPPTIISFTPASGPVGTTVTITGTNFDTTPANNIVKFNGTTATVSASTATSITTTVPPGATTGTISVTVAGNTAVSTTNFTVTIGPVITVTTQPSDFSACAGQTATFNTAATGTTNINYQWQFASTLTGVYADIANAGGYSGADTNNLSVNTTGNFGVGFYRCKVNGDAAATVFSSAAQLTLNATPVAPSVTDGSSCGPGSVLLSASGGTNGEYRWYTLATGGSAINGEVNATYTTPALTSSTNYYVSINNGNCESTRVLAKATIITPPTAPTITAGSSCGPGTVTLVAAGATNGQYRWYDVPTGGNALSGEINSSFVTPALTASTTYYASINNGSCESTRTAAIASIFSVPSKPTITSSEPINAGVGELCLQAISLTAPSGFSYTWSSGQTSQQISVSTPGNYSVVVTNSDGCSSIPSDVVQIIASPSNACINTPPTISSTSVITKIGGSVSIDLAALIADIENNLDLSSLQVIGQGTLKGGQTSINGTTLNIDYSNLQFSGVDEVTIQVCDLLNSCSIEKLKIDVIGEIIIYNGISPNGDGKNDTWVIEYIDLFEDKKYNQVTLFNRWGDVVWESEGSYDNTIMVFSGTNKNGNELPTGSYFYKIDFFEGKERTKRIGPPLTGYLSLKR